MRPLTLSERDVGTPAVSLKKLLTGTREPIAADTDVSLSDYVREIVDSGLPGIRPLSGRVRRAQLDGYLHRVVDRDFAVRLLGLDQEALLRGAESGPSVPRLISMMLKICSGFAKR